jgi:hypothetical protein
VDNKDWHRRVWRLPGNRFQQANIDEHYQFGGGSIMIWAGISAQNNTVLHVIQNRSLTGIRYLDDILNVHIQPLAKAQGQGCIFMEDNAPVYHARVVTQCLAHHQIQHMD